MQSQIFQQADVGQYFDGGLSGVAYDTAWTARITNEDGTPLFPECMRWILENQKSDGSWGSTVIHYHDRILSTLSALMALQDLGKEKYSEIIERGERYIWDNIENVKKDTYRLIGSELLLSSLMDQAEMLGLNLPYHIHLYKTEMSLKLKKIDETLWYSPLTTLSFSLEFLGDEVDLSRLPQAQLPNGSVGNSPATTAYLFRHWKNRKAYEYLNRILSLTGNGSVPTVYPIDAFEYGWILYNLMMAGLYFERYSDICDFLSKNLGPSGVGSSTQSPIPDADDTAVVLKVLSTMGYPIDYAMLNIYDVGDYYLTFNFEMDPSISTNIHILDFIRVCPEFPEREEKIETLLSFLRQKMNADGFWSDKWHISDLYPTCHAVIPLCHLDPSLAEKAISWIIASQKSNGMWGENGGTLEETSYVIQALMYYSQNVEKIDQEIMKRSSELLNSRYISRLFAQRYDLWVGKVLYTPIRVLLSSVASAKFMVNAGTLRITPSLWR